jgi:glutamate racemase
MDNRPIAIFDSGVGGLTSISAFKELLPHEEIIYFGDTARTPYGSKSPATICEFSLQIADFLVKQNAKTLVVACNTISSVALGEIKKAHPEVPVQGIIEPAAEEIASICTPDNSIGIIGTMVTVRSRSYENALYALKGNLDVHSTACPAFVPLIEEGATETETMIAAIHHYLDQFITDNKIDTLVLACTHYPIIRNTIEKCFPLLGIIDPSMALARALKNQLIKNDMLGEKRKTEDIFYASDLSQDFINMMNRLKIDGDFSLKQHRF